jgi:predicted membrane protein
VRQLVPKVLSVSIHTSTVTGRVPCCVRSRRGRGRKLCVEEEEEEEKEDTLCSVCLCIVL